MEGTAGSAGQVTAGLATAAVADPPEARRQGTADTCRNCAAPVAGAFCSQCGQKTHVNRTIGEAVHEMVHGVLHFDTKLWRTLPLLATRPGFLTRDYIEGRRVRYISPVALFLMTIFLTYIVFSSVSPRVPDEMVAVDANLDVRWDAAQDVVTARADLEQELAAARADPARAEEAARLERLLKGLDAVARTMERPDGGLSMRPDNLADAIRKAQAEEQLQIDLGEDKALEDKINTALANPELLLYKMQQKG